MRNRRRLSTAILSLVLSLSLLAGGAEVVRMMGGPAITATALGSDAGDNNYDNGSNYTPTPTPSKKSNTISVKGKKVNISGEDIAKKKQTITRKKAIIVNSAKGSLKFRKRSGNKKITVAKNGKITVKKGLNPGTYKLKVYVTASGTSKYKAATKTATVTIKVTTISNTMTVEGEMVDINSEVISKAKKVIKRKDAITVAKAKGKVTYAKKSGDSKITVNKKTGDVTVAKGLAPGTYKVKVTVTAAGNSKFKKTSKTATVTIIINPPAAQETEDSETA